MVDRRKVNSADEVPKESDRQFLGISQADYFKARRGEIELSFVCRPCEQHIPARDEGIEVADEATEAFLEEAMDEEEDFEQTVVMSQTFVIETSLQNESYDSIPAAESTSNIAESMPSMNSASGRDSIDSSVSAVGRDSMDSSVSAMGRDSVDSSVSASGRDSMDSSVSNVGRDSVDSSVCASGRDSMDSSVSAVGRDTMDSSVSAVGRDSMDSSISAMSRDSMDSSVSAVGRDSVDSSATVDADSTRNTAELMPMERSSLDATFDLNHRRAADEPEVMEESINIEPEMPEHALTEQPVEFKIIEKGSKRGGRLLVSSDGYSYGVKSDGKKSTLWRCSVRSNKIKCNATMKQVGDQFSPGVHDHIHPGDLKMPMKAQISAQVKDVARQQVFRPAMNIIEDAIVNNVKEDQRFLKPKETTLKRAANRFRAKMRPTDPVDLDFELDQDFLQCEEFLVGDIRVGEERHLVFATDFQLRLLNQTKRWFIDGTFKVVHGPFKSSGQLMSIHGFVQSDGSRKQFPLAFALMSRKKKDDYIAVLGCIKEKLPSPVVEAFVLDFEKGAWQAIREIFPTSQIKGCVFHWVQAVWRNVQSNGLVRSYRENEAVHKYLRQLMALPFLPAVQIPEAFDSMKPRADRLPGLISMVQYIDRQWIHNPVFHVHEWSVFRHSIRTNNDVEGWHHRLNLKAGMIGLGLYRLVPLLRREAELVAINVTAEDLERDVSRVSTVLERRLQEAWDLYMVGDLSTKRAGVGALMKDALSKILANRPEDPIVFLADYFDSIDDNTSLVQRADQILKMTHHSRPLFESNVRLAYDVLCKHKVGKKVFGVNGEVYADLLVILCRSMPEAVMNKLLQKLACAPHEAVPFDVFKSGIFTCCVLQDFVRLAENLFNSLDMQRTGKVNKALCDVVIEQLHTALGSNRKDARRILESGYNLGVDGLYLALERAISRSQRNASLQTSDQFVVEVSEAFLSKVKKQT